MPVGEAARKREYQVDLPADKIWGDYVVFYVGNQVELLQECQHYEGLEETSQKVQLEEEGGAVVLEVADACVLHGGKHRDYQHDEHKLLYLLLVAWVLHLLLLILIQQQLCNDYLRLQ